MLRYFLGMEPFEEIVDILVYRSAWTFINFEKKSPLHGLILVCTFIDFEKIFPPARLFRTARLFGTLEYKQNLSRTLNSILLKWNSPSITKDSIIDFQNFLILISVDISIKIHQFVFIKQA